MPQHTDQIAFHTTRAGDFDIFVMKSDGSDVTSLTTSTAPDLFPAITPDGGKFAFSSNRGGAAEVFLMNANGGSPVAITSTAGTDAAPSWSPKTVASAAQMRAARKDHASTSAVSGTRPDRQTPSCVD